MAQILEPLRVPVVQCDLALNQNVQDIFHALERLSTTVDDVFAAIGNKVQVERGRINEVNNRVSTCMSKIQLVKGSNRATTVFSTAKYPTPKELPQESTMFSINGEAMDNNPYPDIVDDVHYEPADPNKSSIGNRDLSAEILLVYSRLNKHGTDLLRVEMVMDDKGLGPLPPLVPSVGSLMLFNSNINPYKNYQALDNLLSAGREKEAEADGKGGLASAPSTLVSGDSLADAVGLDLTFKPQMGEMASLALPSNLPLDFLADIQYTGMALPSIAPSSQIKADYSLPQITDGGGYSATPSAKEPPAAPKPEAGAPPPPPPPPPPAAPSSAARPPPPPVAAAPPPPPPVATSEPPETDTPSTTPGETQDGSGGRRMSLMDSIKGMGVSKLRSKEEASMAAAKVQKKEESKKPVSMMEEMRLRMQRRNQAISGKKDLVQQENDSSLVKAAAAKSAAAKKTSLFKTVNEGSDDDIAPARRRAPTTESAGSDMSDDTTSVASTFQPPVSIDKKPGLSSRPTPAQPVRRGSLLDGDDPNIDGLLAKVNQKTRSDDLSSDSGSEGDEWDDD